MRILTESFPPAFPFPSDIKHIICCDLDETYIPFSESDKRQSGIADLERFLLEHGKEKGLVIGWITGSNLEAVFKKSKGYITRSPHFICCSLGTELYWLEHGILTPSSAWIGQIQFSGFKKNHINKIVAYASKKGITLNRQSVDYQSRYRSSYYYKENKNAPHDFSWIQKTAVRHHVRSLIAKCNPAAGDPSDCYDIDFIPPCCGKDKAVDFICRELSTSRDNVLAFGDSCNDYPMFLRAKKSFLVRNADPLAISQFGNQLNEPYCHGILSVLREL